MPDGRAEKTKGVLGSGEPPRPAAALPGLPLVGESESSGATGGGGVAAGGEVGR